ncbi:MAG: methyl-accepting chemotaxis protein [Terrisporobacter othiniensis]|uniref:methyl-accepting chemotaxis protein n=1 Tax=Terrisporobacter petrolearius TaxID=1460447 RepID=UPI0022E1F8F2|nr:methyl-accepting chemotaxis protein [Terrisporobacter petrolearius]MDU4861273.1 methyl-accepting chemotaxis protein [Terrisporobacter othiniensis]MDU6994907.1 methyl-accepting chemotaxis protein [Terrisporobacter othiniensis]
MKSIKTKILAMIGGIAILAMIISGVFTMKNTVKTVSKNQESISTLTTKNIVSNINEYFTRYKTIAIQMAGNTAIRNVLTNATREDYKNHSSYKDAYKSLGYVKEKDTQILNAYIASANEDLAFDSGTYLSDKGFDLKSRNYWFSKSEDIEKGFIISQPYEDSVTGNMVVTFSAPVYDLNNKEIIGVAAVDVSIEDISKQVATMDTDFKDGGYTMLISNIGQVLASKDTERVLKNVIEIGFDDKILSEIDKTTNKIIKYTENGKIRYGIVSDTRDAGWKVLLSISKDSYMALVKTSISTTLVIYLIAFLILIIAIIAVTKSLVAPIQNLMNVTEELAAGNLDAEINIESKDETGRLAESMKKLVLRLNEYIIYIDEISESLDRFSMGDLNIDLKQNYEGDFAKIKNSLLQLSSIFKETIGKIVETSENVAVGSKEIANAAQVLAEGSLYQASTTEELTATVNDLSDRVSTNADNALNASKQVKTAGDLAIESNDQMKKMILAIEEINSKSTQISKIIKVIEDISFQTNILALNAAVEASRAGAAGKGFAVVADEVRNLATRSSDASKETTHLIEESVKAVQNGNLIAVKTGKMLENVLEEVSQSVKLIDEISLASVEQASALKQTLEGIEQISTVVQTNAATAQESSAASNELSNQAQILKNVASGFKIQD